MSKYSNTIEYNIRTTLDNSGIAKLQSELTQLQNKINTMGARGFMSESGVNKTLADIKKVQTALTNAFNPKLGMLNTSKFMSEIKGMGMSMNSIYQSFSQAGAAGTRAFTSMYGQISKIDTGLKSVSKTTDKIINTFGNTFRWGLIASAFAGIMNSVHQAGQYVQELDKSLTNIMMVSGESRENMNEFAKSANEAAIRLGATTTQMTEAAKVFVQQGMSLEQSQQMGEYAVHLANISEQDSATTSDELTAMKNAFKINIDDMGNAISKWAIIANKTAVDMEELSVASQKAASVAQTTGVSMEQFAGHIAAIEATTREAPENIGNGLKTLYSRFADVKLGKSLEDGVDLGQFGAALKKVGVDIVDTSGQMRDVGAILEDTMKVWGNLSKTDQNALATTVAGRFQLGRFEALMNSQDIYQTAVGAARSETGTETYDRMQETYRESLEGRMKALGASVEKVFLNIFESSSFNGAVDALTGLVNTLNELIEATGGGSNALLGLSAILMNLASNNISRGISNMITNVQANRAGQANIAEQEKLARAQLAGQGLNTGDKRVDAFATDIAKIGQYAGSLNEEQQQNYNNLIRDRVQILNDLSTATEKQSNAEQVLRVALQENAATGKMSTDQLIVLAEKVNANSEIDLLKEPEFRKASSEIKILTEDFAKFEEVLRKGESSPIALAESAENLSKNLIKLRESGIFTEEQLAKVNVILKQLEPAINGNAEAVSKLSGAFLTEMSEALTIDIDQLKQLLQVLGQARGEVAAMGAAEEVAAGQMQHMAYGVELQNTANQIVGLVSGIGQLAFAWQSFQGLGSIWANEDLSFGEKFLDTIINISFALPMLMTGLQQIATGWTALSTALKDFSLVQTLTNNLMTFGTELRTKDTIVTTANTAAKRANVAAQLQETAAKKDISILDILSLAMKNKLTAADVASIGVKLGLIEAEVAETLATKGLSAALRELLLAALPIAGPFLAIAAAITAVAIPIGIAIHQAEEAKKKFEEDLTASNQIVDTINSQKKSYDELYSKYQETGESSDELKEKAVALAESLGVQGAQALADAGHFDSLNAKIQEATKTQLAYNASLQEQNRLQASGQTSVGNPISSGNDITFGTGDGGLGYTVENNDTRSVGERLGDRAKVFEDYAQKIREANIELIKLKATEGDHTAEIAEKEAQINKWKNEQKDYQSTVEDNEYLASLQQQNQNEFQSNLLSGAFDSLGRKFGGNLQQYRDFLLTTDTIQEEYTYLQKTAGQEAADSYLDSFIKQIADRLPNELKSQLEKGLKEAEEAAKTSLEGQNAFSHITGERRENILKDAGLDESQLPSYVESFKAAGGAGIVDEDLSDKHKTILEEINLINEENTSLNDQKKRLEENNEVWDDQLKAYRTVSKQSSEYNNVLNKLNSQLEENDKTTKELNDEITDMALRCMETNTGLKELEENWDKINAGLESSDIGEQTEALTQLDSAVSKIVNIEPGSLDKSFYTNPENMEMIQELMQGNLDRLDEFRAEAARGVIIKMHMDGEVSDDLKKDALNIISLAEAELPDVEVGAYLENGEFIAALNQLAAESGMTVEQLNSMFEGLGIEIEPMPVDLPFQSVTATLQEVEAGNGIGRAAAAGIIFGAGQIVHGQATGFRVKKLGGGGGGAGYRSGGGSGGSGGGGGGGGGGDGGGSENEPKHVDATEASKSEDDIYNKVDKTLDKLADDYTKVSKAKDRMHGDKYRKAAEKELENLAQQNATLKERIDISEKYAQALRTGQDNAQYGIYLEGESLGKYGLSDSNMDGVIDNYISAYNKAKAAEVAAQKAADDYYNSLGGNMTEDQQNHYEELTKKQKEAADHATKLTEIANKYQETMDKIRDDTEQVNENLYEMEDIQIDLFKTAVDTVDAYKEMREQATWLRGFYSGDKKDSPFRKMGEDVGNLHSLLESTRESGRKFFDDMIAGAKDAETASFWKLVRDKSATKFGDGTSILDMRQFYLETLLSNEGKAIFGSNTKEYQDLLDELYDAVLQDLEDIEDRYNDLLEDILDAYDEINDAMDNRNKQIDYQNKALEHQRSLIELIHGDEAYGMFGLVNDAQITATLLKVDEARRDYDYWVAQRDKFDKKTQKELWDAMNERVLEYGENLQEATEESAQVMVQQYMDATDKIIQDFRNKMFGGSLDDAEFFDKEWEMANDQAEQYLDTVESAHERDKLRLRYQKMLDQTNDLLTQNKIKQAMKEQLEALENQKKAIINNQGELEYVNALSQFDVDLANAKVEALQKQIALEEAQRNKNQMELRRDTQGNYRYVYTANEDDLLNAQEELADAEYDIYEMSKQRYGDVLNERWALQQEYEDKIRWARERYKDDTAKLNEALNEINEWYTERQVNLGLELQDAQAGMIEGVEHLAETTSDYVSQLFEDISQDMQDNWGECMENIGVAYSATLADLTEDTAAFREEINDIHTEIVESANDFSLNLTKLEAKSRTSFNNIKNNIAPINSEMEKLNQYTDEFLSMISADTGRIDEGARQLEAYRKEIESLKNSSSALANTLRQTQAARDAALGEAQNYKTKYTNAQDKLTGIANGTLDKNGNAIQQASGGNTGGYDMSTLVEGIAGNIWIWGGWGNNPTRRAEMHTRFGDDKGEEVYRNVQSKFNSGYGYSYDPPNSWGYYKDFYPSNFDTGGYTGAWGVDGRMAVLHEKELVLNATDTENMLAAVSIVRTLVDNLKSLGLTGSTSSLGKLSSSGGETVEQRVEITAEFPNVDDSNDIRTALLSLSDSAYQYAYRNRGKNV